MVFYLPVTVVGFVVAGVAEQHQVVLLGGSAVLPFDDVVGHAPFGFGPAADATLVAGGDGGPELRGGVPVGSANDEAVKQDLICELDACVAFLYDLDEDDLAVVYETFSETVDYSDRHAAVLTHFRRLTE